jgi:putative endonuclease
MHSSFNGTGLASFIARAFGRFVMPEPRESTARRQSLGRLGEQLAQQLLRSLGYVIERTNLRFPVGEIDIVAHEQQTLCFIEVRSTSSSYWGGPLASITDRKRRHLIRAAQWYLSRLRAMPAEIRFDVVAIEWSHETAPSIQLLRGAFTADRR